jgi:hypothetical protein
MAKITDPDDLRQGFEVDFDTGSLVITLFSSESNASPGGNSVITASDGVAFQALYSFAKEEWKNDDNLIKFPFPFLSITAEQFEVISGWNFSGSYEVDNDSTHYLLRDGGWAVVSPDSGQNTEEWMNLTTLGTFDAATDQAYYYQTASGTGGEIVNTVFPGAVNQGINIYESASGDSPNGITDYRDVFKIYLREQSKTYAFYDLLTEQNLSALTYRKFALPLTNGTDLNISASDAGIKANPSPYNGMSISYFTESFTRTIGSETPSFKVLIDGNQGTKQQIYEWVQLQLRSGSGYDIDAADNLSNVTGSVAEELLEFVGDTLKTKRQTDVGGTGAGGVYIDNFRSADTNTIAFRDNTNTEKTFPFVAAGTLTFNDNLQSDTDAIYKVFFTNDDAGDNTGRDFGTQDAIIILQNDGTTPITGSVATSASFAFDFDYDNNTQRGNASLGSDVPFTGVALGLGTAQYVVTTGTITRSTTNTISFVSALERNYSNPS